MEVSKLPAVVITKILAGLNWIDKLNAAKAITTWKFYLETACSWPILVYQPRKNNMCKATGEVNQAQMNLLLFCIEKYGKHMKHLHVEIFQEGVWYFWEFQLFEAILKNCRNIRLFKVTNSFLEPHLSFYSLEKNSPWSPVLVKSYLDILKKEHLKEVHLVTPRIDWAFPDSNPFIGITNLKLQNSVTVLDLWTDSLDGYSGYMNCLADFKRLKRLVISRSCVNNEILLEMVSNNLIELVLYQDEELFPDTADQLLEDLWKRITKISPNFKIDLMLSYVTVLKNSFPAYMPLRKLVLDGLQVSITKGLMDEIIFKYHSTLESFYCNNSNFTETTDTRMEVALIDLVKECELLQELEYDFSISSRTVLLLAKIRPLQKLKILRVEVSYDFKDFNEENHSPDELKWLKEHGENEEILEKAVSCLLGYSWALYGYRCLPE